MPVLKEEEAVGSLKKETNIFTPMPEDKLRDLIDPEERRAGINHPPFNSQESRPDLFTPKDGPGPAIYEAKNQLIQKIENFEKPNLGDQKGERLSIRRLCPPI